MTITFKNLIDRNMWIPVAPAPNAHAAGMGLCGDMRNDLARNPFVYQLTSNTVFNRYNAVTKAWNFIVSPALAGTFGAGAGCVFVPSFALKGTIAAGATTLKVTLTTALPTAVGTNMLSNRGGSGDYSYRIRITGNSAGASGKVEERWIVANTSGTTPTIDVDVAFTFTPANGDTYEILSGRVFMLGAGTLAAGSWKSFEVASNTLATKGQTNLPATISTDFSAVCLDEQYVPYNRKPGEGFLVGAGTYDASNSKGCLIATAIGASSLTGQASAGDAAVLANEYRNFQIRVVEDTATPTAVGQRRIIASHTAGPSAVYTLGTAWTVNPSATAKFVIENPNLLLLWSSASTTTFVYNYTDATINNGTASIAADAWHATYFAVRGTAMAVGCTSFGSWGIVPDTSKYARHSFIHSFRGGGAVLDIFDIAAAINGAWNSAAVYDGNAGSLGAGSCGKYAPYSQEGRFGYMNVYVASAINQIYRYDVKNRVLCNYTPTEWIQAGTAAAGDRLATLCIIDGANRNTLVVLMAHLATNTFEIIDII